MQEAGAFKCDFTRLRTGNFLRKFLWTWLANANNNNIFGHITQIGRASN